MKKKVLIAALLLLTGCTSTVRTAPTDEVTIEAPITEEKRETYEISAETAETIIVETPGPKTVSFCAVGDKMGLLNTTPTTRSGNKGVLRWGD